MLPYSLIEIARLVAAMQIVVAKLPSGDIERMMYNEVNGGVQVRVERSVRNSDTVTHRTQFIRSGQYTWKINEEHRNVLMAPPGRPTGIVSRVYTVEGWIDRSRRSTDAPDPFEAFKFYAPDKKAAEDLQNRLRRALKP